MSNKGVIKNISNIIVPYFSKNAINLFPGGVIAFKKLNPSSGYIGKRLNTNNDKFKASIKYKKYDKNTINILVDATILLPAKNQTPLNINARIKLVNTPASETTLISLL